MLYMHQKKYSKQAFVVNGLILISNRFQLKNVVEKRKINGFLAKNVEMSNT